MKKLSFLMVIAALALTGCTTTRTHTRTVDLNDPYAQKQYQMPAQEKASLAEINKKARRRNAYVTLADGRTVKVRNLLADPDSTSWFDAETGLFERVRSAEVRQIKFLSPKRKGTFQRFVLGAGAGAIVGGVVGFTLGEYTYQDCDWFGINCDERRVSAGRRAAVNGAFGAFVGGLAGAVVGRGKAKYYYRFETATPEPVVTDDARREVP